MRRARWWWILSACLCLAAAVIGFSPRLESPQIPEFDTQRLSGPDAMRKFFADWHAPYDAVLPPEIMAEMQAHLEQMPKENPKLATSEWELAGPSGMSTPESGLFSGRILDLNVDSGIGTRVAAASGGLWEYRGLFPIPLTDDLSSQWISTFDAHPHDPNTIIVGTGEPKINGGTGIFRSTDGGASWFKLNMATWPGVAYRIRYSHSGSVIHMAAENGYFRSIDGGNTWGHVFSGDCTDLTIHPWNSQLLGMTVWDKGIFLSYDEGLTWDKLTGIGAPVSDLTRGAITMGNSNPGQWYASFARENLDAEHVMKGIFRTYDYGVTWWAAFPSFNYMGGQGWYNNVIAVCPTDANLVLAGGVQLLRSTDAGFTWDVIVDDHLHADYHAIEWSEDGSKVWVGHDGGWSYSNDQGKAGTWDSSANYLPITQYYSIDAAAAADDAGADWVAGGGTQDNGTTITTNGGSRWSLPKFGDASGFLIWPHDNQTMYVADGVYSGNWLFLRNRSVDSGVTWTTVNNGIFGNDTWLPRIRLGGDEFLYTNAEYSVYRADPANMQWIPIVAAQDQFEISELTVSSSSSNPIVYTCLNSDNDSLRLMVYESGVWTERSAGLIGGTTVRKVVPHPHNNEVIYALMNGVTHPFNRIYRSDDQGANWINLAGDPVYPAVSDLVIDPHHDQILYLATEYGVLRTIDGGASWDSWNLGMPDAVVVTELRTLDHREIDENFYIVAGTFGRSIWRRLIEDPFSAVGDSPQVARVLIRDVFPNPANPRATIRFALPEAGRVEVEVHDVRGALVRVLMSGEMAAGEHEIMWDGMDGAGRSVATGTYLAVVKGEQGVDSRKLTLIK